jgi:hypothetical protein
MEYKIKAQSTEAKYQVQKQSTKYKSKVQSTEETYPEQSKIPSAYAAARMVNTTPV